MNSTIQKRIDAIQRGETPKGYKKTQWGTIPINWDIKPFNSLFSRITRKNDINNSNVLTISAQYGLVNQESFFNKSIASENKTNYFLLRKGDFAYNKSYSTGYPFGAIKPLVAYETGIVSPLYICFTPTDQNSCPDFYEHYFEGGMHNREIKAIAEEGARNHGLLNMSISDFFNSFLLVPPLPEQEAIAEILTQQDRIIDLKQRLIEEKRRQKKYLMQTLLTGKIRLPGFKGKWKNTKAREVFIPVSNKNNKGDLEVLSVTQDKGVIPRSQVEIDIKYNEASVVGYKLVQKGNFVISLRSFQGGIEYSDFNGVVSPAYTVLENAIDICHTFYKYYFKTPDYINRLSIAVYGIRDGKQISYNDFSTIHIPLPPLPEQEAIAEVLSTADEELSLLERELEQEKLRKKALMQLLLTGLVRIEEL